MLDSKVHRYYLSIDAVTIPFTDITILTRSQESYGYRLLLAVAHALQLSYHRSVYLTPTGTPNPTGDVYQFGFELNTNVGKIHLLTVLCSC